MNVYIQLIELHFCLCISEVHPFLTKSGGGGGGGGGSKDKGGPGKRLSGRPGRKDKAGKNK